MAMPLLKRCLLANARAMAADLRRHSAAWERIDPVMIAEDLRAWAVLAAELIEAQANLLEKGWKDDR